MPQDKIESLIRKFTRELEALVRSQLREEIGAAVEACLAGQASPSRARGRRPVRAARAPKAPPAAAPVAAAATEPAEAGKRRGWTRESVIAELSTWLLTGTVIEAAFLSKHGPPGLVAAARKHFGRFDAALNAANVHLARLHPEGLPTTNRRQRPGALGKPAVERGERDASGAAAPSSATPSPEGTTPR